MSWIDIVFRWQLWALPVGVVGISVYHIWLNGPRMKDLRSEIELLKQTLAAKDQLLTQKLDSRDALLTQIVQPIKDDIRELKDDFKQFLFKGE